MNNRDYWQTLLGETAPEDFMRTYGSMDPELCVSRFLEDRGHLYGVVNQESWRSTFQAPDQFHRLTVRIYLLSYLDETRDEWGPALEAKPPSIPRRYREKFDQDKYPPPPPSESEPSDTGEAEGVTTAGSSGENSLPVESAAVGQEEAAHETQEAQNTPPADESSNRADAEVVATPSGENVAADDVDAHAPDTSVESTNPQTSQDHEADASI